MLGSFSIEIPFDSIGCGPGFVFVFGLVEVIFIMVIDNNHESIVVWRRFGKVIDEERRFKSRSGEVVGIPGIGARDFV